MNLVRILLAAAVLALISTAVALGQGTTLNGVVGPSDTISLSLPSGAPVRQLDPGTYTVNVSDRSEIHNFHLVGPGVNEFTGVEFVGTRSWTVTFRDGVYSFNCDVHGSMFGQFTAGNPPATPPPPPASVPPPVQPLMKLAARIGPGKAIALTRAGRTVTTLKAGRYSITVRDASATDNFHLLGPGVNRKTPVAARATVTWTLALKRGTYTYRSDATPTLKKTFRVT